jgi:hypothetical protein
VYTIDEKLVSVSQQDLVRRAIGKSYLQLDPKRYLENNFEQQSNKAANVRKPARTSLPVQKSLLLRLLSIVIKF